MRVRVTERDLARLAGRPAAEGRRAGRGRKATARAATPREREIQKAVVRLLEARGAVLVRVNGGMLRYGKNKRVRFSYATRGTPSDLIGSYRGRPMALEVKRPGEQPTAGQRAFLDAWEAAGGVAAVVYSAADAEAVLAGIDAAEG
jgi:hypothetical protein